MSRTWTPQQHAIREWMATSEINGAKSQNLVVQARAGCGKTSVILWAIDSAPEDRIILCAFNKRIADELAERLTNPRAEAKTLHALGFAIIRRFWPNVRVEPKREWKLAERAAGAQAPDTIIGMVSKLAQRLKETEPFPASMQVVEDVAYACDAVPDDEWADAGWGVAEVSAAAVRSLELARERTSEISYSDMLYLPLAHKWATGTYDMVVVDECLVADTPILLADGTSKPIREIVDGRLKVDVLSYDSTTGQQVARPVTDWKRTPLRKRLVCVTVQQIGYTKSGKRRTMKSSRVRLGHRHIVCTEDHRFYVGGQWVEAKSLNAGAVVQLETKAPRDTSYNHSHKHGIAGKAAIVASLNVRQGTMPRGANQRGPTVRGGNGCGLTAPQAELLAALGPGWVAEHIVCTDKHPGSPNHYKIDLANPSCMTAIEVDGSSHNGRRRAADARKDAFLRSVGWTVVRVTNADALRRPHEIVKTIPAGCIVDAEVVSVEERDGLREPYVYDLTVEDTHCYYAHGVLVHNCQDMSSTQLMLAQKLCREGGRICVVGDKHQAIYGFRGAGLDTMQRLKDSLCAAETGLTVTFRCPKLVVERAKQLVPDFSCPDDAPEGVLSTASVTQLPQLVAEGDVVLSRTNAPLAGVCLSLLRAGIRSRIEGRDIGAGLLALVKKWKSATTVDKFLDRLQVWEEREVKRAEKRDDEAKVNLVRDQAETLRALSDGLTSIRELTTRIESLFADSQNGDRRNFVVCSSIHRGKGAEWDRVFLLEYTLYPNRSRRATAGLPDPQEERNLEYVAASRAKRELISVSK